jgi:hypothetical protein
MILLKDVLFQGQCPAYGLWMPELVPVFPRVDRNLSQQGHRIPGVLSKLPYSLLIVALL